jgi:hypothetical protein
MADNYSSKPCVCGGMNPDCCWCLGSGVARTGHTSSGSRKRRASMKPVVNTRMNTKTTSPPSVASMQRKVSQPAKKASIPRDIEKCPYCRQMAHPSVIRDHIERAHAISKTGATSPRIQIKQYPPLRTSFLIQCSFCNASLRPDRLSRHLAKIHRHVSAPADQHGVRQSRVAIGAHSQLEVDKNRRVATGLKLSGGTTREEDIQSSSTGKKTCETCGKIWLLEKFEGHLCRRKKTPMSAQLRSRGKSRSGKILYVSSVCFRCERTITVMKGKEGRLCEECRNTKSAGLPSLGKRR